MKKIFYLLILISFVFAQQGLNLEELESDDNGTLMYPYSGKVFEYWPNGDLKVRGRLRNGLRNGKWDMQGFVGNWTFYYKTGQQWQEGSWKDGIPSGEHVKWYPNGNTKTILTYESGELQGPITKWFEDGQVKEEAFYNFGKLDSSYSTWYSNGSKKEEGDYFRGIQNGHWTFWHENGELKRDGSYSNGEMDGIWVEYAADGNSIQRSRYNEGLFLYDLHWGPKELYTRSQKLRKKNIESSILVLDNIVNSFKESKYATRSQFLKAEIYMNDLKDFNAAIREYKAVVKLFPTSAQAQDSQYMVSYIYGSVLENKKQAKKEYKSFLKKYPSSRLVSAVRLELKQLNSRMARK